MTCGLLVLSLTIAAVQSIDTSQCIAPLGMESGAIADDDITASSSFDSGNVGPQHGRVRQERNGGAWCPKNQITTEPKDWLEIDLHSVHVITATETQGRFGNGQGQEFAEAYILEYWRARLGKWVRYRDLKGNEVITGNTNTYLEAKRELDPPIWASKIRFYPYSYHRRTVCMRVEIYGCYWKDGIVSYSMPQGDKRGATWEFFDATYDGHWDAELQRGLGQLTDGKIGPENFKMGYYDYERGQGWVGWRNDTRGGAPVEIKFEFDRIREFNSVHIYCNNQFTKDVQVFSEINIWFSVGGTHYYGDPINYSYMEDKIFEHSRNVSIKLHRRVGKYVKLQLHFAARWIMLSEVTFDSDRPVRMPDVNSLAIHVQVTWSLGPLRTPLARKLDLQPSDTHYQKKWTCDDVAHGNFTPEVPPHPDQPVQSDIFIDKEPQSEIPVAKQEEHTYMAVIIGVLMAVIIVLAFCMFLIISRHRQRKCFASPLAAKTALGTTGGISSGSSCGTAEKAYSSKGTLPIAGQVGADTALLMDSKGDDYQEPYQALKYAPYYSYSTVVMEMKDALNKPVHQHHSDTSYDYAVPDVSTGTLPLLPQDTPPVPLIQDKDGLYHRNTSRSLKEDKLRKPMNQQDVLTALKRRLEQTTVPEFPRHRLRMITQLGEGAFGTVYVAEADGIPEYGMTTSLGKRLVAVKFLLNTATEKEKADFDRDVRILGALEDINIARVLGVCSRDDPICVVMEYLDHGDLTQFLKTHVQAETSRSLPLGVKSLSFNCLLYMATQIASGMRYLESLNFVHRDLATRNCLVGKAYHIKISDFGTDNEAYACDYYKVETGMALPVRWMAWESVFLGKYTTKSDVWSFGVTLWEILTLCRHRPFDGLSDGEIVENLGRLQESEDGFVTLPRPPPPTTKDITDLMLECWRQYEQQRPTFTQIHLFLQRKNLGYAPVT